MRKQKTFWQLRGPLKGGPLQFVCCLASELQPCYGAYRPEKEFMTDKASFRAIIEQWPTVKCYNIKRFLQFSATTKPHDKTLICYYFLSSGCAKGKTKKLKIVLSKYKTKLKIDLSKYILYFHHRQISVDCWQSHLIQRGKTFSLKLNSTKCGWESIYDAAGGFLKNHDTFIQSSCKKNMQQFFWCSL